MKTLTCPKCQRVRPEVSEQGASITLNGMCFSCLIQPSLDRARELEQLAGYQVVPCPNCAPRALDDCGTCGGMGVVGAPLS